MNGKRRCGKNKHEQNVNVLGPTHENSDSLYRDFLAFHLMFVSREIYDYDEFLMPLSWHIQVNYSSWLFSRLRERAEKRGNMYNRLLIVIIIRSG